MLPIDQERREVAAATHLQGKGYEPDLIFAAMINAAMCFAVSNHGCAEAAEPGRSGNPAGGPVGSRHRQQLNGEVIAALLRDFRHGGPKAIERVRRAQPAAYLKILALLCPREHTIEHTNLIKSLSDQELEGMIEYLQTMLEAQAGGPVKVIEGTLESTTVPA